MISADDHYPFRNPKYEPSKTQGGRTLNPGRAIKYAWPHEGKRACGREQGQQRPASSHLREVHPESRTRHLYAHQPVTLWTLNSSHIVGHQHIWRLLTDRGRKEDYRQNNKISCSIFVGFYEFLCKIRDITFCGLSDV